MSRLRRASLALALGAVSIGLLVALLGAADVSPAEIGATLRRLPALVVVTVVVLTGINLALGTMKWLVALAAIQPAGTAQPRFADAMLTTTAGALLGQVMPVQVGVALTRITAARISRHQPAGHALGATAYEQLFDAVVLMAAASVGLITWTMHGQSLAWLLLVLLMAGASAIAATRFFHGLGALLARMSGLVPWRSPRQRLLQAAELSRRVARLPVRTIAALLAMSVLRYLSVLARAVALLVGFGLSGVATSAAIAFPVVQAMSILPITPGNLGVLEWTWSAVLSGAGAGLGAAAMFAIQFRIVTVAAQLAVLALAALFRLALRRSGAEPIQAHP